MIHRWISKIPITDHKVIEPDSRIVDAFQNIGYSLEAAVADLIDNSIDAEATQVAVRFLRSNDQLLALLIADDGRGMDDLGIDRAMQFGGRQEYSGNELGMYGMGLKSASLSQADSVTVLSQAKGRKPTGRRWTSAGAKAGWRCDVVDRRFVRSELATGTPASVLFRSHGTIIRWDEVKDFRKAAGRVDSYLQRARNALVQHLGLQLHRFLVGATPKLTIVLDTLNVETTDVSPPAVVHPLDPFAYPRSGAKGYPRTFRLRLSQGGHVTARAHIWPPRTTLEGYKLGGGAVSRRQGFYFYRNDRLIQAGGWNNYREDGEPHLSLARVSVDLTPNVESFFSIRFNKSAVDAPRSFVDALTSAKAVGGISFSDYIDKAITVYRTKTKRALPAVFAPGRGIRANVGSAVRKTRDVVPRHEIEFVWGRLPTNEFFRIDRAHDRVIMNSRYRHVMLSGRPASSADIPVIKTLLYLVVEDLFHGERQSGLERERLESYQAALIAAVKEEA